MTHNDNVEFRLAELLSDRPSDLCELMLGVRAHVKGIAKGSSEILYKTYAVSNVFTYSDRLKEAFIHIAVYGKHLNLGFNYGASLDDPQQILEGTGKLIRHIRIESLSQLKQRPIKSLIQAATAQGREMAEEHNGIQSQQLIDKTL